MGLREHEDHDNLLIDSTKTVRSQIRETDCVKHGKVFLYTGPHTPGEIAKRVVVYKPLTEKYLDEARKNIDLSLKNCDYEELLRTVMKGFVKGEFAIDGDLAIRINKALEGVVYEKSNS